MVETMASENITSTKLWGEIPLKFDTEPGIAVTEMEQITKRGVLPVDGPRLFQPSETLIPISKPSRSFTYNPTVIHTIKLLQYVTKVRNLISQVQLHVMTNSNTRDLPSTPLIPSQEETECTLDLNLQKNFLNSEIFRNNIKKWPDEISNSQVMRLSRFDVGVICAHTGFDTTTSSVLDFLADISRSYTQRICRLLQHAVESEIFNGGNSGDTLFVNVLERVFHDVGIGSMTLLEKFYENRVLQYHKNVSNNCKALQEEYENLRNLDNKSQFEDLKMIRIKDESIVDIDFSIVKEEEKSGESTNNSSAPFEEFQNLSNIDSSFKDEENIKWPTVSVPNIKQENFQPADLDFEEEIINVNDSPNSGEASKTVNKDANGITSLDGCSPKRLMFQKLPKIRKLK